MECYIGAKIIRAEKMSLVEYLVSCGKNTDGVEDKPGYKVMYPPDNHPSWSPAHVFETSYRLVTPEEKEYASPVESN